MKQLPANNNEKQLNQQLRELEKQMQAALKNSELTENQKRLIPKGKK